MALVSGWRKEAVWRESGPLRLSVVPLALGVTLLIPVAGVRIALIRSGVLLGLKPGIGSPTVGEEGW